MIGAAIATAAAYVVLFVGMAVYAPVGLPGRLPVAPQRRPRLAVAVALTVAPRGCRPLARSRRSLLVLAYPLALLPLGFYQPAELGRLRRLASAALSAG